jgi:hypothetical protein
MLDTLFPQGLADVAVLNDGIADLRNLNAKTCLSFPSSLQATVVISSSATEAPAWL